MNAARAAWIQSAAIKQMPEELAYLPKEFAIEIDGVARELNIELSTVKTHAELAVAMANAIDDSAVKVRFCNDYDAIVITSVSSSVRCRGALSEALMMKNYF
ncbi:MAG: hypothetical protein LBV09_07055 [Deferribacteraceae bacterium]|jgi:hypothetical protein|nr:hypothetical protein [Deferribacteraceae bacterium]